MLGSQPDLAFDNPSDTGEGRYLCIESSVPGLSAPAPQHVRQLVLEGHATCHTRQIR